MSTTPWFPEGASELDVWNVWNKPTSGTFVLDGATILFDLDNIDGAGPECWRYIELTSQDVAELDGKIFDDVIQMREIIESLAARRGSRTEVVTYQ